MQKSDAARIIAGLTSAETKQSSAPTSVHVMSGEVVGNSESGKVQIRMDGDVVSPDDEQIIEIDALGGLEEGDTATILLTGQPGRAMAPMAIGSSGSIDRVVERVSGIETDYVKATRLEADVGEFGYLKADQLEANVATFGYLKADSATITDLQADTAKIHNLTTDELSSATGYIKDLKSDNITVQNITAATGYIKDLKSNNITAQNITAATGYIQDLASDNITAQNISAATGYIQDLTSDNVTAQNLTAATAYIEDLTAGLVTADGLIATAGYIHDLTAGNVTAQNLIADHGEFDTVKANAAKVANLTAQELEADHATIGSLDTNYASINMENVNNSWITNGTIARAAIKSEMVESISANKLTAGVINAYDISVTNLHASSLIVDKLNGQPVIGGYTYIPKTSSGYSSKNPKSLGWYEMTSSGFVKSDDTTVDMTKAYYLDGEATELYDRTYIDNLASQLGDRIDGAIETFTTDTIPTLNNYPASDWLTDKVKDLHVGDICYVVNSGSEQDGYCYRFTYDKTSAQYKWVLIKDNQVTAALGRITDLETFESNTTSWQRETDEGLTTIRTNHTNLSGVVDKTVTETKQLWFTKANTTAPSKPSSAVTSTSTAGNAWRVVVPAWNDSYPNYYYCLQYKLADGTYSWSDVVRDIAMGESQATSRDAQATADSNIKSSIQLWFTKSNTTAPSKPSAEVTTNSASTVNAWNKAIPTYNSTYPYYFYCYQQQKGDGTYQWTDVVYDRSISEAQAKAQASLPSSTFETFKSTTFKEVVDEVDEQSSKITNLTTRTSTIANPNLAPFFSYDTDNYTTSSAANNEKYWYRTNTATTFEMKGDGWCRVYRDNSSGTGVVRTDYVMAAAKGIEGGKDYTFLFEFRNNNSVAPTSSTPVQVYTVQQGNPVSVRFWGSDIKKLLEGDGNNTAVSLATSSGTPYFPPGTEGVYIKRFVRTALEDDSTYYDRTGFKGLCTLVAYVPAGGVYDCEMRVSIYAGEYLGPYKPYVPITEYSVTSNTVNNVKQTADANLAHITNLTTTLGTNADGTSKSEDIVHKYNTLDQTLDGTISRVGKTEAHLETVANPNLSPFFTMDTDNVYNASSNPNGYWGSTSVPNYCENLSDGWAHYSYSNTGSSTTWLTIYENNVWRHNHGDLKGNTTYTVLMEFRNVTKSGNVVATGITANSGSNVSMFKASAASQAVSEGASLYFTGETVANPASVTASSSVSTRTLITMPSGSSLECDLRVSLYEGEYEGSYKPYVDQTLSERVTQAESSITQTQEEISLRVTKADYAKDVSVRLRMIRDKWTDTTWADHEAIGYTSSYNNQHAYTTGNVATGFDGTTLKVGDLIVIEGTSSNSSTPHALTAKVNSIPSSSTSTINLTTIGASNSMGLTEKITNAETAIQQNSEAITLSAKKTEAVGNMLYDTDVNGLTAVNGPGARYFSSANQASTTVASFVALTDPPEPGIHYAAQFVCNGENTVANSRGLAFYQPEDWTCLPMVVGQTYVASYWARRTSGTGYVRVSRQEGSSGIYVPASKTVEGQTWTTVEDIGTEWRHIAVSFTHETKGANYDRIWFASYFPVGVAGTVQMCGFKLAPQAYATSAELKVANDEISTKVEKNGVISSINQSSESVTINANKVNIAGAAIFSSGGAFDTSATVVKSEMQWYSSTSASSATGGSWKNSQPSVAAGHYIWQRELVTYANGNTAYKPSSAGVCIQGQTDLSAYSTTSVMNAAISTAVDDVQVGGRNLLRGEDIYCYTSSQNTYLNTNNYSSSGKVLYNRDARTNEGFYITNTDRQEIGNSYAIHFDISDTQKVVSTIYIFTDGSKLGTTAANVHVYIDGTEAGNGNENIPCDLTDGSTKHIDIYYKATTAPTSTQYNGFILQAHKTTSAAYKLVVEWLKWEKGTKATDWSPAPEDIANEIDAAIVGQGGFTILWDYSAYATQNLGEGYICALDPTTNETSDANGWVMWNGVKRTVPKGMINPNSVHPFNIPLFVVLRLSSATATTGTNYVVHYDDGWKSGPMSGGSLSDWEWVEETDIVIGSFVMTGAETSINSTIIFRTPWSSKQVTTATVTANSAYALANTANNTANAAAPKSGAIARSQRIYYRQTTSGAAPGKNTTWLASSGTGYGNWSLSIPQMTTSSGTKYPKLYTAVQTQTVAQQAAGTTCTCSTVLLDDSITVIDGGSIITGSITANILKATVIDAVNDGDGTINADKINVSQISIGQSQVSGLGTALAGKETAGAAAAVQANLNTLSGAVTWMGTCSTAATTAAKVVTCAGFNSDDLKTGATICVRFNAANTLADAITLNVNSTGAKTISVGQGATSDTNQLLWASGSTIRFYYNGTYWRVADTQPSYYGTCSTAAGTAAKTSSISGAVIYVGTTVNLNMTNANTNTSATLNVSSTGAKAIYYGTSSTRPTTSNAYGWHAAETAAFVFDGQYWRYTNSMASYQAAQSAKTASNYIYASSNGIKIANSSPSTATTYQLQTATGTEFVYNNVSVAEYGADVRIGPSDSQHIGIANDGIYFYQEDGTSDAYIKVVDAGSQLTMPVISTTTVLGSYATFNASLKVGFYGEDIKGIWAGTKTVSVSNNNIFQLFTAAQIKSMTSIASPSYSNLSVMVSNGDQAAYNGLMTASIDSSGVVRVLLSQTVTQTIRCNYIIMEF